MGLDFDELFLPSFLGCIVFYGLPFFLNVVLLAVVDNVFGTVSPPFKAGLKKLIETPLEPAGLHLAVRPTFPIECQDRRSWSK